MKKIGMILIGVWAMQLASCSDTAVDDPLAPAWQAFQDGNYQEAHDQFEAFEPSEGNTAVIGLGWVALKMDSLPQSDRYFAIVSSDTLITDHAVWAYSGWAMVAWARNNIPAAATRAAVVLRNNESFELPFYAEITKRTMWLLQAYGYYHSGNLASCLSRIQDLDPDFSSTLNSSLLLDKLTSLSKTEIGE